MSYQKKHIHEIKENHDKIKTLTENNEALTLRVENLTKNIKSKDK